MIPGTSPSSPGSRPGPAGRGQRLIVRRVRPTERDKNLTDLEKRTGWRYAITATNIPTRGMARVPGSGQAQWIDAVQRQHAVVQDRVRTNKTFGLHNLPSKLAIVNTGWIAAANIAADLDAWLRLLGLYDQPDLARAEPATMRFKIYSVPARFVSHARKRRLRLNHDWPWAGAFETAWHRLCQIPENTT